MNALDVTPINLKYHMYIMDHIENSIASYKHIGRYDRR
jgi:hypothetical protein